MGEGDVSGSIPAGRRFELLEGEVRDLQRWAHDGPESVDQWRAELRGAFSLVRFADQYGMTVAEATAMLEQQQSFDRPQDELSAAYPSFNDGWSIGRGPDRQFVVSFHKTAPSDVAARAATHGLAVTVTTSRRSKAQLSAVVERLATELAASGYDASLGYDLASEKVSVLVKTGATAGVLRTKFASARDEAVELSTTTEAISVETATYTYGGAELRYQGLMSCTSGFSMKDTTHGTDGVLTAGHCVSVDSYRDPASGVGYVAVLARQYKGIKGDFGYVNVKNIGSRPYFYASASTTRDITSVASNASIDKNDTYCTFGRETRQQKCSEVLDPAKVILNGGLQMEMVQMNHAGDVKLGDSGAPWFINNVGVGITHGYLTATGLPVFSKLTWADDGLGAAYQVLQN